MCRDHLYIDHLYRDHLYIDHLVNRQIQYFLVSTVVLCFITSGQLWAQSSAYFRTQEESARFRSFSQDFEFNTFRDFATSPLFYSGIKAGLLHYSRIIETPVNAHEWHVQLRAGTAVSLGTSSENTTSTMGGHLGFSYRYLHKLQTIDHRVARVQLGATLLSTQNFRFNPSLQNNNPGVENISNLMLSAKLIREVSRKSPKTVHFYFFKKTFQPVRRELHLVGDVGLLNLNYRPGYAYIYEDEINGTDTDLLAYLFSDHRWSLNGWRLRTETGWTRYLNNGNAIRYTYQWDALHAPGRFEAYQQASHSFGLTYLFRSR